MCRTRKGCHIGPSLRNENGSRASRNAGDGHEKCEAFLKRRQALFHFLLQLPNTKLQKIEMGQGLVSAESDDGVLSAPAKPVAAEPSSDASDHEPVWPTQRGHSP